MDQVAMMIPKQIVFLQVNGVQKLVLENLSNKKLAVKIRTNHKTALHIHPTHDFIEPNSKKDVIVKLLEYHQGVKLEVNYTLATQQMIAKGNSKMENVDKKYIKKDITTINVSEIKGLSSSAIENKSKISSKDSQLYNSVKVSKESSHNDDLNNSFMSIAPQKVQTVHGINKLGIQKKSTLNLSKQTEIVVEQRLEEDQQQFEQNLKKMKQSIKNIQVQIQKKKDNIFNKKAQLSNISYSSSVVHPMVIPVIAIAGFLLGSLIKGIIF